jgi:hypothetical protein
MSPAPTTTNEPIALSAMARRLRQRETGRVRPGNELDFLWGPGVALLVVGVLALLLRWAFSHGSSVVERRPRAGHEDEYGALVPVAAPDTVIEAEMLRLRLVDAGIRATTATTVDGPRVLVFPEEARTARAVLRA